MFFLVKSDNIFPSPTILFNSVFLSLLVDEILKKYRATQAWISMKNK